MKLYVNAYRRIARTLGLRRVVHGRGQVVDYNDTAFIYYPEPTQVRNRPASYDTLRAFMRSSKEAQRRTVGEFVQVPTLGVEGDGPWVVRPRNHSKGVDFHVCATREEVAAALATCGQGAYVSSLFRRDREYRVVFVGGKPVVTLHKRRLEGVAQTDPWNFATGNAAFETINDADNDRLRSTSFYQDAERLFAVLPLDLCAMDVGYRGRNRSYTVFEANLAPNITIPTSIAAVRQAFLTLR